MKKTLLLLFMGITGAAFTQSQEAFLQSGPVPFLSSTVKSGNEINSVSDTLTMYLDRATGFYTLDNGVGGYVLGTSSITTETCVHYDAIGNATITHLMIYFGKARVVNTAENLNFYAYTAGADSLPSGSPLASGSYAVNNCDTNGFPAFVPLSTQNADATGSFLVSVEYGSIDDKVAVISTNPTNSGGGPDGNNESRVIQRLTAGGQYIKASQVWTISGSAYNADALILPVVEIQSTGLEDGFGNDQFLLHKAYPNPTTDQVQISFTAKTTGEASLSVLDIHGRPVYTQNQYINSAGKVTTSLDVSGYAAGTYFYILRLGGRQLASSFQVVR